MRVLLYSATILTIVAPELLVDLGGGGEEYDIRRL